MPIAGSVIRMSREQDRGVEAELVDRLERDLARELRRAAQLEERRASRAPRDTRASSAPPAASSRSACARPARGGTREETANPRWSRPSSGIVSPAPVGVSEIIAGVLRPGISTVNRARHAAILVYDSADRWLKVRSASSCAVRRGSSSRRSTARPERGTMFLKASTPPPIGTLVRIDLELPSATVIELTGVGRQARHRSAARRRASSSRSSRCRPSRCG